MKRALNYSPQAAALLDAGKIEFDLYKTTEWPSMIADAQRQRPAYAHFPFLAGRDDIGKVGFERVEAALTETGTPYVNTHIAPRAADFGVDMFADDAALTKRYTDAMLRDIATLTERYGADKVILENANYDPNYDIPIAVIRPALITRMVRETGCGFLLDLGHAKMSAVYFGMDVIAYLEQLPLDALRELHVAGTRYSEEERRLVDHYPMTDDDWTLVEWALRKITAGEMPQPWALALEYGGAGPTFVQRSDPVVIERDMNRLSALLAEAHLVELK